MATFRITFDEDVDIEPDEAERTVSEFIDSQERLEASGGLRVHNVQAVSVDVEVIDATDAGTSALDIFRDELWGEDGRIHNINQLD